MVAMDADPTSTHTSLLANNADYLRTDQVGHEVMAFFLLKHTGVCGNWGAD